MTSKLLRIVPAVLALSIHALAADPPAAAPADPHHEAKDAKKKDAKKEGEKKDEKKVEEKKDEKK
jgi:ribosomal protein L12E/L44/L45/RPP1/RPP2